MNNKIVVVGGICTGKDFVTHYICEKYGFTQIRFADGVYWVAENVFRMKRKNRKLLQTIGQGGRKIYPRIWVRLTFAKAKSIIKQGGKVIISDCRQRNEIMACIKDGYTVLNLYADMQVRIQRAVERDGVFPDVSRWTHSAEVGAEAIAKKVGYTIINNLDTPDDLYRQIDEALGRS